MMMINSIPQVVTPTVKAQSERPQDLPDLPSDGQKVSSHKVPLYKEPSYGEEKESNRVTDETLQKTVKKLNEFSGNLRRNLKFSIDEKSNRTVVTVLNSETNEVIRQIPSEEVLSLASNLEKETGVILNVKV